MIGRVSSHTGSSSRFHRGNTTEPTPSLITSGLLIQLDAHETDSYPGTGTTVYDLINNYDHTLGNGATFTTLNGIKCFDCTTGIRRIEVNGTGPTLPTTGYTYITWAKLQPGNPLSFRTLLYTNSPKYTPITIPDGTNTLGHWDTEFRSSGYDLSSSVDTWVQYTVVGDDSSQKFYINGSKVGSTISFGSGGTTHWGWGNNNVQQPWGHVANLYFYNRKLSLSEITQHYNFLSPRFVEPTPTPTITPTITETVTPTPTPTDIIPVTGYSFNLVDLPYNFPSSGNSIMNDPTGNVSGSTEINLLATTGRGFYFNKIDSESIDRISYYSGFTGHSVTITLTQNSSTAIYSGDTDSFKFWTTNYGDEGFVFGTNIGFPPTNIPSGVATLIQAAPTPWVIGDLVYVSVTINESEVTPTPTITETVTPTITPTITETVTPTITPTITPTSTPIVSSGLELYYDPSNSTSYPGSGTTLYDLSPSALNASISGGPTDSGNWFTFTGSQSIQTGNLAGLYSGWQHTLEIWFNASAAGAVFSDTGDGPTNTGYHSTGLEVYQTGPVYLTNAMLYNSSSAVTRVGGGVVSLNNWYQLVRVYNGSNTAYAYLNKVKSSETSISWTVPNPDWYLNFGSSDTTKFATGAAFQGKIGVIRLYNRVLSQSEITQNYDAEKSKYGL